MKTWLSFVLAAVLVIGVLPTATGAEDITLQKTVIVTDDTYAVNSSGMTSQPYGTEKELYTRNNKTLNEARQTFLKFDCSDMVGAKIQSAVLYMKSKPKKINNMPNGDTNILVSSISNKSWTEEELTWVNRPTATTGDIGSFYYGLPEGGDQWCSLDITDYLENEPDKIASLILNTEALSGQNRCYFYAKEAGAENAPRLEITYQPADILPFSGEKRYEPAADTYVANSTSVVNKNYGSDQFIYTRSTATKNEERRGFIRFSCPELIGNEVDSAVLYLKGCPRLVHDTIQDDTDIIVSALSDKYWPEFGTTWKNQPTETVGEAGRFFYQQVGEQWYTVDVTNYLNSQPDKAISFLLTTENTSNNSRCYFYSKEAAPENRPYLVVKSGFKNMTGYQFRFTDTEGQPSETPVTGGSVEYSVTLRSSLPEVQQAVFVGAVIDKADNQLLAVSHSSMPLALGKETPLSCKIDKLPDYDMDRVELKAYIWSGFENIQPLLEPGVYKDPNKIEYPAGRISMVSPAYRDTIEGETVKLRLYAPSIDVLTFSSAHQPDEEHDQVFNKVFAENIIPGPDGYVEVDFPASEYPYGPISITIIGTRNGGTVKKYVQLYNNSGERYNIGMPDTPPAAQGMSVVFYDDFIKMPTISRTGKDSTGRVTTYSSHTPYNGDYGLAAFEDFEGQYNPFEQVDSFLKIKCRKPEGYAEQDIFGREYYAGTLSSMHPGKLGKSWSMAYFECRMMMPPGYGSWPSFWLLSANRLDPDKRSTGELDVVEGYMYEEDIAKICISRWSFADDVPQYGDHVKFNVVEAGMLNLCQTFHTYGCKITEETVYFYVDDQLAWTYPAYDEVRGNMMFLITMALGQGGGGIVDLSEYGYGADLYVDYVRVFM